MAKVAFSRAVEDSVAKVDDEIAVGEDLEFQRRWWRFERGIWIFFATILVLDLAGAFGRGPLAKAERRASDGSMDLRYDRIQRTGTPSEIRVGFGQSAVHDGKVLLYASDSLVKDLGAERVAPSPASAVLGNGGLTYSFPVSGLPASIEFGLEPEGPGMHHLTMQVVGQAPVAVNIFVMP